MARGAANPQRPSVEAVDFRHHATKAELGTELVARDHATFQRALDAIAAEESDARRRLRRYAELYSAVLRKERMCLCGMLASEFGTLPRAMREAVNRFFDANERWLMDVLEQGRKARALDFGGPSRAAARRASGGLTARRRRRSPRPAS